MSTSAFAPPPGYAATRPSAARTPGRKRVPGPRGYPVIGVFHKIRNDPLKFSLESAEEYGDIVEFRLGKFRVFLLNDPEHFEYVLSKHCDNYHKSDFYKNVKPIFGDGLVTSEGDFWKNQRQLAQPAFHRQQIAAMAEAMTGGIAKMLGRWEDFSDTGQRVDVLSETMELALINVANAMFGTDVDGQFRRINDAIGTILRRAEKRIWSPVTLPYSFPTLANIRSWRAVRVLDETVYSVIGQRRRSKQSKPDLLSMLLDARSAETGEGMSDKQLRDEVLTMFVAGHETVGTTAAFTLYMISKHPEVERRLVREIEEVLGDRRPTFEDLPKLVYHMMVIQETMRIYPPAWTISRKALADDEIGGHRIPAGSNIMLSPYVMHRNPRYWDNPEAFDPDRFAPENAMDRPKYAYLPFGGGPRGCIGKNFALMEIQLLMAMTLQKFHLQLVPGYKMNPEPMISLRPKGGVAMTLRKRN